MSDRSPELGEPGLGLAGARWLADQGVACVGADNWGLDVAPPASPGSKAYEFLYIFNPVPIKGASGSLGVPLAIR
jgi:hypothetical protein